MKNIKFSTLLMSLIVCSLMSSCAKEETPIIENEYIAQEQTAEQYIAANELPAILFSYNVLDIKTDKLTSWLIDVDGNIRTTESESDAVYEGTMLSTYYMDQKKSKSTSTDSSVDLEELVANFKQLRGAQQLTYDTDIDYEEVGTITSVYGYYFASAQDVESCGCESSGSAAVQMYNSVLLEQKTDAHVIQTNAKSSAVIAWLSAQNIQGE